MELVTNHRDLEEMRTHVSGFPAITSLADSSLFLPPVIAGPATITSVNLTTGFEGHQPVFCYQVKWVEKKEEEEEQEKTLPLLKKKSSIMRVNSGGNLRCDGPCAQFVPLSSTVQFGCDHAICEKCRKTAQSTTMFDGSPGCCNEKCVQMARENGEKVCVGQSDSAQTLISQPAAFAPIQCHVVILKETGGGVQRLNAHFEFPSSSRLSKLISSLAEHQKLLANSRYYYSLEKPKNRNDCLPISLMDTHLRFYDLVDTKISNDLYFMVVAPDVFFQ